MPMDDQTQADDCLGNRREGERRMKVEERGKCEGKAIKANRHEQS